MDEKFPASSLDNCWAGPGLRLGLSSGQWSLVVRRLGEGVEERIIASGFGSEWSECRRSPPTKWQPVCFLLPQPYTWWDVTDRRIRAPTSCSSGNVITGLTAVCSE